MMNQTVAYLKEWQQALQQEIRYLKKYGSTNYQVFNGQLIHENEEYSYYFQTTGQVKIPTGSLIKLKWGNLKEDGWVLAADTNSLILSFNRSLGNQISEAFVIHDPWELLEQLIERLDECKKSKKKRIRINRLMNPSMEAKQSNDPDYSNVRELFLRSKYNPVTYVWGPPGTGKTYTLARTAANHYLKGKKVLLLSHSNQAVDVLMAEIASFLKKKNKFKEGELIRYSANIGEGLVLHHDIIPSELLLKHEPALLDDKEKLKLEKRNLSHVLSRSYSKRDADQLLELEQKLGRVLEKIRRKEIGLIKEANVIGSTLAKAATDSTVYDQEYDLVILDEASMAYVPQAAFAASLGKHIVVCGDFKQLPPIASANDELVNKWLKEDVFNISGVTKWVSEEQLHPHLFLLKKQRRMHPDISAFTNRYIYHSLVGDHESVKTSRQQIVSRAPFPNSALQLVDTSFTGEYCFTEKASKSRLNLWQLLVSFQLIHESYLAGARSIGYVAPYRAQAKMMDLLLQDLYRNELLQADLISATVHKFQGSERDVMIFDTVDSDPLDRPGMLLTGKGSERLINVAITRTKGKFIQVSNTAYIKDRVYKGKTLRQLVDHQEISEKIITPSQIGTWIKHQHPRLKWMHARKLQYVFQDIQLARKSIILSVSNPDILSKEWKQALDSRRSTVHFSIISENIPFPFLLIDKQYLWLGVPIEAMKKSHPPYVAARLDSPLVASQFLAQLK